jgi:hypothetical protein
MVLLMNSHIHILENTESRHHLFSQERCLVEITVTNTISWDYISSQWENTKTVLNFTNFRFLNVKVRYRKINNSKSHLALFCLGQKVWMKAGLVAKNLMKYYDQTSTFIFRSPAVSLQVSRTKLSCPPLIMSGSSKICSRVGKSIRPIVHI